LSKKSFKLWSLRIASHAASQRTQRIDHVQPLTIEPYTVGPLPNLMMAALAVHPLQKTLSFVTDFEREGHLIEAQESTG